VVENRRGAGSNRRSAGEICILCFLTVCSFIFLY
jgi:hypothetical protein